MALDQSRRDEVSQIAGFLTPIWSSDPDAGARAVHWLGEANTQKILAGYACGECLADYGGIYRSKCPVCHHERDVERDVAPFPQVWKDHLDARRDAEENPVQTRVGSMEDVVRRIQNDPAVEHVALSKLGKSKWGRG